MRLYTYSGSANAYKAELLLHQLDVAYDKVEVAIFQGAGKGLTSLGLNALRDVLLITMISFLLGIILELGEEEEEA